jgi:hypothetical protein
MIATFGVVIALLALFWQIRVARSNLFADYSKRYQGFILNLSVEIYKDDFDITKRNDLLPLIRTYFDLCSDDRPQSF